MKADHLRLSGSRDVLVMVGDIGLHAARVLDSRRCIQANRNQGPLLGAATKELGMPGLLLS